MPHLIVQEQRTRLIRDEHGRPMGEGKTNNQDMRLIEPLYGRLVNKMQAERNSKDFSFEAFLEAMDRDREANLEAFRRWLFTAPVCPAA
jgi:hypothetical protein